MTRVRRMKPASVIAVYGLAFGVASAGAAEPVRFNRDIRPILSDKCFHCHGPDKNKRDSGLRLDVRVTERLMLQSESDPQGRAASDLVWRLNRR